MLTSRTVETGATQRGPSLRISLVRSRVQCDLGCKPNNLITIYTAPISVVHELSLVRSDFILALRELIPVLRKLALALREHTYGAERADLDQLTH